MHIKLEGFIITAVNWLKFNNPSINAHESKRMTLKELIEHLKYLDTQAKKPLEVIVWQSEPDKYLDIEQINIVNGRVQIEVE